MTGKSMRKVWLLLMLAAPLCLFGQSVSTTFGGSQVLGLAGIQTNFVFGERYGWTGVGYYDGRFQLTGYLNVPFRVFGPPTKENRDRYRLGIGDHELNTWLTTDEYEMYKASVRGASIYRHTKSSDIQAFLGSYTNEESQPYLRANYQANANVTGAVIGHFVRPNHWELQSFNTVGKSISSIQSIAWTPLPGWHITTAGGVGSNHPYLANAVEYRKGHLNLRASFTSASDQFHRQESNYSIEPQGFNAKAEVPLWRNTTVRVFHRRELIVVPEYLGYKQNSSIGATDGANVSTGFFGFRASASVSESSSNTYVGKNYSEVFSVARKIIPRWQSTFSYLRNSMPLQDVVVQQNSNEFRVNNHLYLTQNLARINGSISNTFGARWSSNLVSFSIDNEVYTSPIAAQFGQKSVFQAWTFSIRLRTPHGTTAHLDTNVDPMGRTRWGGYLSGLRYQRLNSYSQDETYVNFSKYVVHGKVMDEAGKGVWGIAIQLGPEVVYSDTEGAFFLHVKNSKPLPLVVVADASLQSASWKLQSAPELAQGALERDPSSPIIIVVQMARRNTPSVARTDAPPVAPPDTPSVAR